MTLRIAGKHMEIGDAFRMRIEQRIGEAVAKYFDGGFAGHVTVEKSGSRYDADCVVHLDTGTVFQAGGKAQDPQIAFDAAAERIDKQLRRYKRRLKAHGPGGGNMAVVDDLADDLADEDDGADHGHAPAVVAESRLALKSLSVAEAVAALDGKDSPVLVFRNSGTDQVNIVYHRSDGNIGWIDPAAVEGK